VGELYYQCHRGTYTSQARTKRGNRKSELALREAEMWGVAAKALKGQAFPAQLMDETWKKVLLNQFHDIIPGSSIHRVYEEAEANYAAVITAATEVAQEAMSSLADRSRALTVFNSLSWARTALVTLPEDYAGAQSLAGEPLPVQVIGDRRVVETKVPPCGWTTLLPSDLCETAQAMSGAVKATERLLENDLLRVEFNERGEISSIYDKEIGRELVAGTCNCLRMYKDIPTNWDAWDIDSVYPYTPVELVEPACYEVVASGPLVAMIRVRRKLNQSTMTQEISLRRGARRMDFATQVDWQESHKMLKACFAVNIQANEALHEIQFGHIRRPNHKSRPFDADRFEVSNHKWSALVEENRGFAVLNDCKYGLNVVGNSINLTLLRSPLAPDMTADKGRQEFTYAFYAWNGSLGESAVVREAYELNCPLTTATGAAGERSLFSLDADNVIIEAVKPAVDKSCFSPQLSGNKTCPEDGSGDVIIRLYESKRMATRCTLSSSLGIQRAAQTDMLERPQRELKLEQGEVALEFRPFEIKTVRLRVGGRG
jgi:alpha-mannosidase